MNTIQENDYVLLKKVAEFISGKIVTPLEKINLKCSSRLMEYEKLKAEFLASETYEGVGKNSKKLNENRKNLITLFAVQDRIEKIAKRNKQRLVLLRSEIEKEGIYNDIISKKTLSQVLNEEKNEVTEENLNLNIKDGVVYKYFNGKVLAFKNGKLDLSLEFNKNVLVEADASFFHEFVSVFPSSVKTIPDEYFMVSNIKNNVLKECILYVASKMKTQTIKQSNAELGGLLENVGNISNISEYAEELKNYLNVSVKQCMKKNMPALEQEINSGLRCNESSEFLPASKRVAPLANGIAGDIPKTEAEVSEEIRKEQEKENKKTITNKELLDLLLADDDDLQEQHDTQTDLKKAEEERQAHKQLEQEREEQELALSLKKNDTENK